MLNKRQLLIGASALLATPYIPSPARAFAPRTAHVVTGIDDSFSVEGSRAENLGNMAEVIGNDLPEILARSSFDQARFEVYFWSIDQKILVEPLMLDCSNCTVELGVVAATLAAAAKSKPMDNNSWTDIVAGTRFGLSRFNVPATKRVLNIVTDDDSSRNGTDTAYRPLAQAASVVTNGFILGNPEALGGYFNQYYKSGPGSFTLYAASQTALQADWRQKFIQDLF